ncbi:MAG: helix-turn-helix transcriptional regulator [Clostridiaceae bacterium]|nr:helix-turn-helix transcriptional regulator [Clostridiaceae bacterium]
MRLLYTRPILKDLSQGSRIAFIRQIRLMSQDEVSNKLGLTGECKRRTMTRYEKGNRSPKEERTREIAFILKVNYNAIKKYEYKDITDIIYTLLWLEELIPNYNLDLTKTANVKDKDLILFRKVMDEWTNMKTKRSKREISYLEYIEWKMNLEVDLNG